jgi:hypothetical protein
MVYDLGYELLLSLKAEDALHLIVCFYLLLVALVELWSKKP